MVSGTDTGSASGNAKVAVSRWLFHRNASRVHRAIVQSNIIAGDLREHIPELGDRIRIIPQPAPQWLVDATRRPPAWAGERPCRLFYPATPFPHINHSLLNDYAARFCIMTRFVFSNSV